MKLFLCLLYLLSTSFLFSQSGLVINEIVSNNEATITDEDGDYSDWIEIYNGGSADIDLSGYGISDLESAPYHWTFPSFTIPAGGRKVIFASGKDRISGVYLHTNFKLSAHGEPLLLTDPSGNLIDFVKPTPLSEDVAFGRSEDGSAMWERLKQSTPFQPNSDSDGIVFSHESGFYPSMIQLDLDATNGQAIRYTTDGTDPITTSTLYSSPLALNVLDQVPDVISQINTSPYWTTPAPDNFKAHIIKAATFNGNQQTSRTYTKVIFITPELNQRYQEFDIVSVVTPPENLFNTNSGIYVPGVHFNSGNSTWTGNYFQKGVLWQREANLQYFNSDGELEFNQEVGIRVHGGKGRNSPQKSLRIYSTGATGAPKLNYPFFENFGSSKRVFDKVVIRNSRTCWNQSVIKDEVTSYICKDLDFDVLSSNPVVVFINGEYWGVQSIREYYDDDYINENYGVETDSVNIVIHGSGNNDNSPLDWGIVEGTNEGHIQLYDFLNNNNLSVSSNYEYITSVLDISSIVDYYCTQIYFNNKDWPTNNNKLWNDGANGKWRQLFYDIDGGWKYLGTSFNLLQRATATNGTGQNSPYATFLFRKLLESPEFEDRFLSRMACLMRNEFHADTIIPKIEKFRDLYESGMQEHIARWNNPSSVTTWNSAVNGLVSFANGRTDFVIQHIENHFGITFNPNDYDCDADYTFIPEPSPDLSEQIRIYPNPAINNFVWVDYDFSADEVNYLLSDLGGRILEQGRVQNHGKIQMHYPPGVYVISILERGQKVNKRIVLH